MRDHRKLEVFQLADELALAVYAVTREFPSEERYALSDQLRRASVSIAANIVEGAARSSEREFLRFLVVAYGSACEVEYLLSLANRLRINNEPHAQHLADRICKALRSMIHRIRNTSGQQAS